MLFPLTCLLPPPAPTLCLASFVLYFLQKARVSVDVLSEKLCLWILLFFIVEGRVQTVVISMYLVNSPVNVT